jgi:hypothetical protein
VWEVRARGAAQLSTFELMAGENPRTISHVASGDVVVVVPQRPTFTLRPDHPYILDVWGTELAITRRLARFSV